MLLRTEGTRLRTLLTHVVYRSHFLKVRERLFLITNVNLLLFSELRLLLVVGTSFFSFCH